MLNHRARKSTSTLYYSLCITFLETSLDLNCVNDYEKEMTCHMTPDNTNDCSEYKLNVSLDVQPTKTFICRFEHIYSSACECKFQVNGFVVGETFKANLLRKGNVLFTKYIKTRESIKPKRPIIISISLTENGNFRITWDTKYTHGTVFYESLSVELTYSVKGNPMKVDQTNYEFVGRNLQPNSNYIVWARVVTNYNDIYSDYSEPYEFSTCKIVREWWDKIPVPTITHSFEKKHSLGHYGDLSHVIYAQTGYESVEETDAKCDLHKKDQAGPNHQMPESNAIQKYLQPNNMDSDLRVECGSSSGSSFSNRCYMGSDSSGSCFRDQPIRHSAHCQNDRKDLFSSFPCNGCSGSADTSMTHLPPSSNDFTVILGYQSTSEVLDHGNKPETDASLDQAFISSHDDVNQMLEMAFCSTNAQDVSLPGCESTIMPVDNGYQPFQSLDRNTGEQWSADCSTELQQSILQTAAGTACHSVSCSTQQAHAPSLKGLCHPLLHISLGIQIDCSYQKV
uniref:Fibronectin type-III domain-containing protein n=1 Tax=Electrophorus electricus TaxID=8005 RepID=A0AAY5EK65_ELEEL